MISINEKEGVFHLYTDRISYLFRLEGESPRNLYWGKTIDGADAASLISLTSYSSFDHDVRAEREEYPLWNGHSFCLPCLRVQRPPTPGEADRAIFCTYKGYEAKEGDDADRLELLLEDDAMGLQIRLCYLLDRQSGILARSTRVTAGKKVTLTRVMSASVSLPSGQASRARWLTGKWAGEFRLVEKEVCTGIHTLQSRSGIPGHHFNPSIALAEPCADEQHGRIWFGALGYSGNWSIEVEKTIFGNTHIVAGINDFDFEAELEPGTSFDTPVFYTGFTEEGFGGMSRCMHRFVRDRILPRTDLRPVVYNSWEATFFDVRVEEQKRLAEQAAAIGCELFVVDDGWFGERNSDRAGLGDWWVNTQKFPNGLHELIDHVKGLGMRFGIWVEPEAINPDSNLYRMHPDWIYRYPNREPLQLRNQYLLNMSLPPVQKYLQGMLHDLLSGNDISFIKWDMNRVITDPQSAADGTGKALWHGHVQALYALWRYIRENFPHVEMETCSGGGGRIDLGILRYAEQTWPSDNTDPYTRLFIQEGFTQFYPPIAMMCWVTDSPGGPRWSERPLRYRLHSAMCGALGIGANIMKFSDEELAECGAWIKRYKQWRHIVQRGDLYRLLSLREGRVAAVEYLSRDKSEVLLLVFANGLTTDELLSPLRLQGLDPHGRYRLESGKTLAGSTLMNAGIRLELTGDFASQALYLKKL